MFFKKSGVDLILDYKNFDHRKFENYVSKFTNAKIDLKN